MKAKIEHPKVFISYAWKDDESNQRVADFVNRLRKNGIDTVFDQANLSLGQSMPHFMESCVRDSDITHVLMLLTPEYKMKADQKKGGVGTETQIISQEVYGDVDNTKFVPVIFDKMGASIQECLPIYLKSRFFIDLSDPSTYETSFVQLVRFLFGAPSISLQPLGSMPAWVENPEVLDYDQNRVALLRQYKERHSEKDTLLKAGDIGSDLIDSVKSIKFEHDFDPAHFEAEYGKLKVARNTMLQMVSELLSNDGLLDFLISFFDRYSAYIDELERGRLEGYKSVLLRIFKHEMIVSVIAVLYKKQRYDAIHGLLATSYVSYSARCGVSFKEYFYCYSNMDIYRFSEHLNSALCKTEGRVLLCGLADYWVHNTYSPMVGSEDFANADVLITNLSCCLEKEWFPLSYIYAPDFLDWVHSICISLTSKTMAKRLFSLFGVKEFEGLKAAVDRLFAVGNSQKHRRGYDNSMKEYPLISDYMKETDFLSKP